MRSLGLVFFVSLLALTACGGGGGGSSSSPVTPTATNTAPTVSAANADQAGQVGFEFSYDALQGGTTFTDSDGDSLNVGVSFSPDTIGFSASNGVISGTPNAAGPVTVTVTASDGALGASDSFVVDVGVDQDALQAEFAGVSIC